MDPWTPCQTAHKSSVNVPEINENETAILALAFEDNYKPLANRRVREFLPDSAEYLATLEARLEKLKNNPDFLRQLAEKREACMHQLLNEEAKYEEDLRFKLERPIERSIILRRIAPHRQPITHSEILELVEYDQLIDDEKNREE